MKFRSYTYAEGGGLDYFYAWEYARVKTWEITPENIIRPPGASRGRVRVPILIWGDDVPEQSEFWGIVMLPEGLPKGWKFGDSTRAGIVIECNDGHSSCN